MFRIESQRFYLGWSIFIFLIATQPAFAIDWTGFASGRFNLNSNDNIPEFLDGTKVGLNARQELAPSWEVIAQALANGSVDDYRLGLDMGLVAWTPFSGARFSLGKQKVPTWFLSENLDVGYLYPWVAPPSQVYDLNPFARMTGALISFEGLAGKTLLRLEIYGSKSNTKTNGTRTISAGGQTVTIDTETDITVKNLYGVTLAAEVDPIRLRFAYVRAQASGSVTFHLNDSAETYSGVSPSLIPGLSGTSSQDQFVQTFNLDSTQFFSAGLELDWNQFLVMSEYAFRKGNSVDLQRNVAAYVLLGYRLFDHLLMPHLTYSADLYSEAALEPEKGRSWIAGVTYSPNPSVKVKLQYENFFEQNTLTLVSIREHRYHFGVDVVF